MFVNQASYDDFRRWLDEEQQETQNVFRKDYPPAEVNKLIGNVKIWLIAMMESDTR